MSYSTFIQALLYLCTFKYSIYKCWLDSKLVFSWNFPLQAWTFQISKSSRWINPINPVNISLSMLRSRCTLGRAAVYTIHISRNESPSQLRARSSARLQLSIFNEHYLWHERGLKHRDFLLFWIIFIVIENQSRWSGPKATVLTSIWIILFPFLLHFTKAEQRARHVGGNFYFSWTDFATHRKPFL